MKKLVCILLMLTLVLNSAGLVYANTDMNNQLKKLGFTDHIIKFLSEEEKLEIVQNGYRFDGETVNHNLFINEVQRYDNGNKVVKTYSLDIDENEKAQIEKLNKASKEVYFKEKLAEAKLEKIEPTIYYLDSNNEKVNAFNVSASASYAEDYIDGCVLTTGVYAYDKSTSTKCIKRLGFNFQWEGMPWWTLTDLIAISHTGYYMGLTNIDRYGGTYTYYDAYDNERNVTIDVEPASYGVTGEFPLIMSYDGGGFGEMYVDISNNKSAVTPNGLFYMCGQYGHVTIAATASVSVGVDGSISFTPTGIAKVTKSTKVMYNNILTY